MTLCPHNNRSIITVMMMTRVMARVMTRVMTRVMEQVMTRVMTRVMEQVMTHRCVLQLTSPQSLGRPHD
jgi:hypothetical protein